MNCEGCANWKGLIMVNQSKTTEDMPEISVIVPVYKTEDVIMEEINRNASIKLIVFSRRFGQPAATMAGILTCNGKAGAVIDVDLQDPPELIRDT